MRIKRNLNFKTLCLQVSIFKFAVQDANNVKPISLLFPQ